MTAPVMGCRNCGEWKLYMDYGGRDFDGTECRVECRCGVAGPWAKGGDEAAGKAWTAFWQKMGNPEPPVPYHLGERRD